MTPEPRDKLTETSRVEAIARLVRPYAFLASRRDPMRQSRDRVEALEIAADYIAADPATPLLAEVGKVTENWCNRWVSGEEAMVQIEALLTRLREVGA